MNELITINEVRNDGKAIHLYFNGLVGLYTAYGYSAFALSRITKVNAAYSDNMQMPVVVINPAHLEELLIKTKVEKHTNGYYCLLVEEGFDENEYSEWADQVRMGGGIML